MGDEHDGLATDDRADRSDPSQVFEFKPGDFVVDPGSDCKVADEEGVERRRSREGSGGWKLVAPIRPRRQFRRQELKACALERTQDGAAGDLAPDTAGVVVEQGLRVHPQVTLVAEQYRLSFDLSAIDQRRCAKRSPSDQKRYVIDLVDDDLSTR